MSKGLAKLRAQIDALDARLLGALNERARLAQAAGKLKQGSKVYRSEREAQVLRRIVENNPGPLGKEALARVYTEIISACRALEQPLSVAYLGPAGTFSEMAALKVFGSGVRAQPCGSIDEVFRQVETGAANYGVVPVENSSEGAIDRTHDLLLSTPLKICAETVLRARQNLLSKSGSLKKIVRVYSHPQSLAQCNQWLSLKLHAAARIPVESHSEEERLAAREAGAKNAYIVKEPILAALGAGVPINNHSGNLIINIGGGTSEVAVVALGGIVAWSSLRVAGNKFDHAIMDYIKKKYGLHIGEQTAEAAKIEAGSALPTKERLEFKTRGRDMVSGLPRDIVINSNEIAEALNPYLLDIAASVQNVFNNTPPELVADIMEKGLILSGGGAQLRNIDEFFKRMTGVQAYIADEPLFCVAKGTGLILNHLEVYKRTLLNKR